MAKAKKHVPVKAHTRAQVKKVQVPVKAHKRAAPKPPPMPSTGPALPWLGTPPPPPADPYQVPGRLIGKRGTFIPGG